MFSCILMEAFFSVTEFSVKRMYLNKIFRLFVVFVPLSVQAVTWNYSVGNTINKADNGSADFIAGEELHIVHIIYYHYLPWHASYLHTDHEGCIRSQKNTGKKNTAVLKCMEQFKLLVSAQTAREWLSMQQRQGYFSLTINSFGLHKVHAHVLAAPFYRPYPGSMQAGMVSGISSRHVTDVRKYFIKNRYTQTVTAMTVTPDHLFYAVNKHAFIPIKEISADDVFITKDSYRAGLVCKAGKRNHCGIPWHRGEVTLVYNLEVNWGHQYFAGRDGLLVHNICNLARYLQEKLPGMVYTRGHFCRQRAYLTLKRFTDVDLVTPVLKELKSTYTGINLHTLLMAAVISGKPLKIKRFASYLEALDNYTVSESGAFSMRELMDDLAFGFGTRVQVDGAILKDPSSAMKYLANNAPVIVVLQQSARIVDLDFSSGSIRVNRWVNIAGEEMAGWIGFDDPRFYGELASESSDSDSIRFIIRLFGNVGGIEKDGVGC